VGKDVWEGRGLWEVQRRVGRVCKNCICRNGDGEAVGKNMTAGGGIMSDLGKGEKPDKSKTGKCRHAEKNDGICPWHKNHLI